MRDYKGRIKGKSIMTVELRQAKLELGWMTVQDKPFIPGISHSEYISLLIVFS